MSKLPLFLLSALACGAPKAPPPSPTIRNWNEPPRVAPHGKARVWPLASGQAAFVGRLELDAGVTVPLHRDETEETILVLEGSGTITVDGAASEVGPGSVVFMPAGAAVTYSNGPTPLVAVQVFAGPSPASKYDGWHPSEEPLPTVAQQGPWTISCLQGRCTVLHGGEPVGDPVTTSSGPSGVVQPLVGAHTSPGSPEAWLLAASGGEACSHTHALLCEVEGSAVRSPAFGTCAAPEGFRVTGKEAVLNFPGVGNGAGQTVRLDLRACSVRARTLPLKAVEATQD